MKSFCPSPDESTVGHKGSPYESGPKSEALSRRINGLDVDDTG
jgi:hypothetical protein